MGVHFLGLVGLLVILGIFGSIGSRTSQPSSARNAALVCRQFVRDRLRAPSTATFPTSDSADVRAVDEGDGRYVVSSFVDAQNVLGAMIRTPFTCDVTWQHGDTWHLNALDLKAGQ